ncbi:MAG TPA: PucR family transcriptional regulator ligand-binding domain-containing protein [Synergistales bacterium]|nr:PucR family transcriptional regulator ligand-binding domain-containing protein [Synergistales bacterium]
MKLFQLLALDVFASSEIVAGKTGLNRDVTWVNMMEILDSLDQLQPGELLISTGYGLTEESPLAADIIGKLDKRDLAGIAVQPGYYISEIPSSMIRQADELGFPIIRLQPKITFGKVTRAILDFLTQDRMSRMELPISFPLRILDNRRSGVLEEFFDDLLDGNFHSYNEALTRAGSVGLEISSPYKVAVVDPGIEDPRDRDASHDLMMGTRQLVMTHPLAPKNIHSRLKGNHIVIIYLAANTKAEEQMLFRNIASTVAEGVDREGFFVGVGKTTKNWREFKDSYSQAITALEIGKSLFPSAKVAHYEDLGLYRLLCQIKDRNILREYMNETVIPLVEYDTRHKGVLCRTLRVFLESSNQQETADKLIIHRQTLGYRLRKISRIVKRDLYDPKDRFDLYMGLLIMDIVDSDNQ